MNQLGHKEIDKEKSIKEIMAISLFSFTDFPGKVLTTNVLQTEHILLLNSFFKKLLLYNS